VVLLAGAACQGRGGLRSPRRIGHGGVETCPEVRIAADPGHPHPDRVRCSYSDLPNEHVARVAGSVLGERSDSAIGEPLADIRVSVHPFEADDDPRHPREPIAESISDPRGAFLVEAELRRGEYLLVARRKDAERVVAFSRFTVEDVPAIDRDHLQLIVPRAAPKPASARTGEGEGEAGQEGDLPAVPDRPAWLKTGDDSSATQPSSKEDAPRERGD
jgi:hypothetical protein